MRTGHPRTIHGFPFFEDASGAAEFYVSELVDQEMREQRAHEEDIGVWGCCEPYVVDVRHPIGPEQWQRFRVTVRAKLEYTAERLS